MRSTRRDDIYSGEFMKNAAELQVGPGRRLPGILAVHARRFPARNRLPEHEEVVGRSWLVRLQIDARHADFEPAGSRRGARIIDIAPTVLKYFGLPIPDDIDGKSLF